MAGRYEDDTSTVVETREATKTKKPRLYRVLMHNDDYTTRDFVVHVLTHVFRRPEPEAIAIMMHVHHHGVGVAGVYTREIAETKIAIVERMARAEEFPLRLSMEPEEEES